jgi:2-keto-4-pentenoate hydratase/2-oxohepta-3-ene-1,7-dioic acid hydratase in catechol pathway
VDHVHELNNQVPDEPVVFLKPDTAVLQNNAPFYHPEFSSDIHHEIELIFRVCKEGKYIDEAFAMDYVDKIGIGIDFTARDLQQQLKEKGLPWEKSKAFNQSAVLSNWLPIAQFPDLNQIGFELNVNGILRQKGHSSLMMFRLPQIIAHVSRYFTLKVGDVIFTGTPKGVAAVSIGDQLEGSLEGQKLLDFPIK